MKFEIFGRKYDMSKTVYYDWDKEKKYPSFYTDGIKVKFDIEAESLKDAEIWLIENYPEFYCGSNIVCENGDFVMHCVPDYYVSIHGLDRVQNDIKGIVKEELQNECVA